MIKVFSLENNKFVLLYYLLLSFFMRFPFFFRDYIDKDESTFVIMGQSWVDGNLPYTELWDLKPPLLFGFFALIIYAFGKSLVAIRIAGVVVVAITAFFVKVVGNKISPNNKVGFWSGIMYVILSSAFGSLQGVMSEHLSMLFFVPGILFLLKRSKKIHFFISGLLFGISILMKINLSYAFLLVIFYSLYIDYFTEGIKKAISNILFLVVGFAIPLLSVFLLYYIYSDVIVLWDSMILASLNYTHSKNGGIFKVLKTISIFLVIVSFLVYKIKKRKIGFNNQVLVFLVTAILGVLYSFVKSGKVNGHYLIQVYPFLAIIFCLFLMRFKYKTYHKYILAFLLFAVQAEAVKEYVFLSQRLSEKKPLYNGEGYDIPNYFSKTKENKNVYFINYHIGYWIMSQKPVSKTVTHPSNISRDYLYPFMRNSSKNIIEEIDYIIDNVKPSHVVSSNKEVLLASENSYFKEKLNKNYQLIDSIGGGFIYERKLQ